MDQGKNNKSSANDWKQDKGVTLKNVVKKIELCVFLLLIKAFREWTTNSREISKKGPGYR